MRQNSGGTAAQPTERDADVVGTLARFRYRDPNSGFAVVRFEPEGGDAVAAVGQLAQLNEGQKVRILGRWVEHPRFGRQIEVESAEAVMPTTTEGIESYLSSRLVKGVGPATAARIVAAFGADTLRVIDETPERLAHVKGLGKKKIEELVAAVRAQKDIRALMVFLRAHGLGQGLATRIVERYGRGASALIQANPYRLVDDVIGVGFRTADRLAEQLGIAGEAPDRIRAGIVHVLGQAARDGHCFVAEDPLCRQTAELLTCNTAAVQVELEPLAAERRVVLERAAGGHGPLLVYPVALHRAEVGVARRLDQLVRATPRALPIRVDEALQWFARRTGMELPAGQHLAITRALTEPVSVITGGPGVGKTTIIRALTEILAAKELPFLLAAPTGRAAKRLEESTGRAASTLHRLLEYQPGINRFQKDDHDPLSAELVVVDETSMLDVQLAYHLLRAVAPGTRLVLVGDVDQLPAVGPGSVLADVIASGRVPVTALTEIFRQQRDSWIVRSAHGILRGEVPVSGPEGSDFFFVETRDARHTRAVIKELVCHRIPRAFGLDPVVDVQVLCPMYRGDAGADALNDDLQAMLNPDRPEVERGGRRFRLGDKVMQIRNDYELDVFNGDTGRVVQLDAGANELRVRFGDRVVPYSFSELDQLVPAYAISVHRSQGSEYSAVVLPVVSEHYVMLRRSLVYTAVTRGKRLVVLAGARRALAQAVQSHDETARNSALAARLRSAEA